MKNIIVFFLFVAISLLSAYSSNGQVNYSVQFDWDDQYCSCNEPVTKEARVVVSTYPAGSPVDDSGWFTISNNPHTHYDNAGGIRDCDDDNPCYTVNVYLRYKDNTGICCSGSEVENTTGQSLINGFTLSNTILLN